MAYFDFRTAKARQECRLCKLGKMVEVDGEDLNQVFQVLDEWNAVLKGIPPSPPPSP